MAKHKVGNPRLISDFELRVLRKYFAVQNLASFCLPTAYSIELGSSTFFMQRPILQPNLNNDPLPKISSPAYAMQLCLHNRKSQ